MTIQGISAAGHPVFLKNMRFGKQLLSIFVDFLFLLTLFSIMVLSVFIIKNMLYPEGKGGSTLVIRTERMPIEFRNTIQKNEVIYDTLTKRKVGEIREIQSEYDADTVSYIITIDAKFTPRSESLRTKSLWFKYYTERFD